MINTLTTKLLLLNSTGLHYTTLGIMHYAEFAHLTAPLVYRFIIIIIEYLVSVVCLLH